MEGPRNVLEYIDEFKDNFRNGALVDMVTEIIGKNEDLHV